MLEWSMPLTPSLQNIAMLTQQCIVEDKNTLPCYAQMELLGLTTYRFDIAAVTLQFSCCMATIHNLAMLIMQRKNIAWVGYNTYSQHRYATAAERYTQHWHATMQLLLYMTSPQPVAVIVVYESNT
jgi:hypothetical protein